MPKSHRLLSSPSWQGLGVIVSTIGVVASIFITYDIYKRSTQYSSLVIQREYYFFPLNLGLASSQNVSIVIDGQTTKSVVTFSFSIVNNGRTAIVPSDFVTPIRVTTEEPWRVLAVENVKSYPEGINADWTRVNTDTFEMKPLLLNPGDRVRILIFATNIKEPINPRNTPPEPTWSARIVNVPSFSVQDIPTGEQETGLGPFYFSVSYTGWSFYVFGLTAVLLFIFGLECLYRFRSIPTSTWRYRILTMAIMVLSLSTADSFIVFIFPGHSFSWASYLFFFIHVVLLLYLLWPVFIGGRQQHDDLLTNLLNNKP